jgi:hypothetical protein
VVDVATRTRYANEPFVIRRAVRYEILERATRVSASWTRR